MTDAQASTVLIVEDDESNRLLLRRYLESEGYAVSEAADGPTALFLLGGARPGPRRSRPWLARPRRSRRLAAGAPPHHRCTHPRVERP